MTNDKNNEQIHWVDIIHGPAIAWLILLISLIITLIAWQVSAEYAESRARERFVFQVKEAENAILKRFSSYEQVLRGGLGLFNSTDRVTRTQWHNYINTLQIDQYFPGTLGVGYAQWLQKEDLGDHIQQIRSEGFADYTVRPEGDRGQYSAIVFLEPFNERNQRAFGYDMYSQSTRQQAMARARDTGQTALSGKVTLVQETDTDVQAGFLVYVPHYSDNANTLAERRQSLLGFVYSALRIGDLMQGILGVGLPELDFVIYDDARTDNESMLYDSHSRLAVDSFSDFPMFEATRQIEIGGHKWIVKFQTNNTFNELTRTSQPTIVAVGGLVIDVLLFNVILALARRRKRAQELASKSVHTLNEREIQFKSITDSANDGIISIDEQGLITYFNQSAQTIFGYSAEEINNKSVSLLFPQVCQQMITIAISSLQTGHSETILNRMIEIEGVKKNADEFPMEFYLCSWNCDDKTNFTIIVRDITERKQNDRMKNEFVSLVSHELRTPLTAISGSLALLESEVAGAVESQAMDLVVNAHRNADLLAKLVNDLLDTEKLASGTIRFHCQQTNILDLVKHSIENNQPLASQANLKLVLFEADDAIINVDPGRFNQVMTNLIGNAVKFSSGGSNIEVAVKSLGDFVRVSVTNYGVGIPEEFHSRIFNKFAQADSTDSRKYGGTGLGLSIVKYIVEKFNGTINFSSVPDAQTIFYFDLPVVESTS